MGWVGLQWCGSEGVEGARALEGEGGSDWERPSVVPPKPPPVKVGQTGQTPVKPTVSRRDATSTSSTCPVRVALPSSSGHCTRTWGGGGDGAVPGSFRAVQGVVCAV